MKKIISIILSLSCALVVFAQSYSRQICGNCSGQGGWYSPYGIVYCPACGGNGYILVPNNSVSFRGVHHVTLYDEDGERLGKALYYTESQKVSHGGYSYDVVSSDNRNFRYKLKGKKVYFKY